MYLVETRHFGLVVMVAVGATVVGSINNVIPTGAFAVKGDCHGFFKFGGSTVLVLFQPGALTLDADLRAYALQPLETYVKVGEHIGKAAALQPVPPAVAESAAGSDAASATAAAAATALRPGSLRHDDADYAAYLTRAADEKAALLAAAAAAAAAAGVEGGGSSSSRRPSAVAASLATAAAAASAEAAAAAAGDSCSSLSP